MSDNSDIHLHFPSLLINVKTFGPLPFGTSLRQDQQKPCLLYTGTMIAEALGGDLHLQSISTIKCNYILMV